MKTEHLGGLNAFTGFGEQELAQLAAAFEIADTAAGESVIRSGESDGSLFVLLSGTVDVVRVLPGGGTATLGSLEQGSIFGILGAMDGGVRTASCVATSQVRCARMSQKSFAGLLESDRVLGLRLELLLVRHLFRDLRETNRRLAAFVDAVDETTAIEDVLDGLSSVN